MVVRRYAPVTFSLVMLASLAHAAERRELAPHQHGHGRVDLAIDGDAVAISLQVPGMDLLGFEHAAVSESDRAKMQDAKAALAEPFALIRPPAAAQCAVTSAAVETVAEAHEHDEDGEVAAGDHDVAEEGHFDFRATYALTCADPSALVSLDFPWFDRFPNSQDLAVTVLDEKGQRSFEVRRGDPPLAIGATS